MTPDSTPGVTPTGTLDDRFVEARPVEPDGVWMPRWFHTLIFSVVLPALTAHATANLVMWWMR